MSADRISGLVRRVFRRAVNAGTPSQQVQVESLADEPHGDVEVLETYGYSAVPPDNVDEGLAVFVGGESDHGVVVGWFDKAHRPRDLKKGEVQLYGVFGQSIKFDDLGQVLITSQSGSTTEMLANGDIVHTPSSSVMRLNGTLEVSQGINAVGGISSKAAIHADGDVTAGAISLQNHLTTLVEPGSGKSGVPI